MASNNFKPLQKRWPNLYEHVRFAEHYVHIDGHSAVVKLRCFAEQLVGILYRELNLPCEPSDAFFDKLNSKFFTEIIDANILEKLHAIRMIGNKAAHGNNIRPDDALALLHDAYLIGQWLFKTYSNAIDDVYPPYSDPVHPEIPLETLNEKNKALEHQLKTVKDELTQLENSEREKQTQKIELENLIDDEKLQTFKDASIAAVSTFDLAPEKTRGLISLNDAFSGYSLTGGQVELVDNLTKFLNTNDSNIFLLRGYAGTGKTFVTKGITEYFRAIGRNYVLAAPTGKASKVIAKKTQSQAYTIHKTIYSLTDIVEYRNDDLSGSETYKFYAQLSVNDMSADTVYIVDEASMIADIYHEDEFFRFGSGHLLRDLLKFVNLDHNDHHKKIIFIGDDAQLPPVGMGFSPALDERYLFSEYGAKSVGYELTEIVRQNAGSGIMNNSIKLRQALKKGVFNELDIEFNYPDMEKISHDTTVDRYLDSCGGKINGESILLAHSNSDVAAYNRRIRAHFFPKQSTVVSGDKVLAVTNSNAYGFFISNGDFGLIREVLSDTEYRNVALRSKNPETNEVQEVVVDLAFKEVLIGFKSLDDEPHFFKARILETLLYSDHPGLSSDESKALYLDFCIRHPKLKSGSLEFKEALKADSYFNALRLKFGYAITCHKAQGSEWNNVFVKCQTHQNQLSASYFRWFYTAITRASKKLYLLDPPAIKLGAGIKAIELPNIIDVERLNEGASINKRMLAESDQQPDDKQYDDQFGIPSNASFSLEILRRVKLFTVKSEFLIQSVSLGQYQDVYFFEKESERARIDIRYNGKNKISSISTPKKSEFSLQIVELLSSLIGSVINTAIPIQSADIEFSIEFLNSFHRRLHALTFKQDIVITGVESMDWTQRYTFTKSGEVAVFDIFYNGKHRFTKCAPVRNACTSSHFTTVIQEILTEGFAG